MSYLVMECHLSYAVVLDSEGRMLKVANMQYEVGQTVADVMPMEIPKKWYINKRKIYSMAFVAACFVMLITSVVRMETTTYASVYMTINPSIRIDVNRRDAVIDLTGVNEDGDALIHGYQYEKKTLETVMDELVDRAIELEFLQEGGKVTLKLDTEDEQWIEKHSSHLTKHVEEYVKERITIAVETEEAIAPITDGESDYDDTDYGPNNDGVTDYEDTDYGPNNDGVTDYDDTDYGPDNDGVTDYEAEEPEEQEDDGSEYHVSDYESSDEEDEEDDDDEEDDGDSGISPYEEENSSDYED